MTQGAAFRGQPLLLLGALMVGWLALRVALWQPAFDDAQVANGLAEGVSSAAIAPPTRAEAPEPRPAPAAAPVAPGRLAPIVPAPLGPPSWSIAVETSGPVAQPTREPQASPLLSGRAVVGHSLLLVADLAQMDLPPALIALLEVARPSAPGVPAAPPMLAAAPPRPFEERASRWSADGWLLLRRDTTTPFLSGRPSYGRSQAGAVVRYRLAQASTLRPQAYLRASTALAGAREQELAAGISLRPLASVPLRVAAEARAGETARGTRLRPAAYAVTELPPMRLPLGVRAEAYAQGGYVGGDDRTAFVDGQARIERPLVRRGELELSAGAAAWGGAQRDAARLDIGPTATLSFRLGDTRARVAADYRFRVAGDAEPSSGPALTVSAGF